MNRFIKRILKFKRLIQSISLPFFIVRLFKILGIVFQFCFLILWNRCKGKKGLEIYPIYLREAFSKLGMTFVKFGQILAMRPDFIPEEYCTELLKLVDDVPSFENDIAENIIETELGAPPREIFSSFSEKPIAAASFGQVYFAQLKTGESVIVKVQRPNLKHIVETDLGIIEILIWILDSTLNFGRLKFRVLLDEFKRWTMEELDYIKEACYAEQVRQNSQGMNTQKIPEVYWQYTTRKILVMEFLDGVWLKDLQITIRDFSVSQSKEQTDTVSNAISVATRESGNYFEINCKEIAKKIVNNFLSQAFVHGVFHGDPHAGNLVILNEGKIGYVDFGITGKLSSQERQKIGNLFLRLSEEDVDGAYHALMDIVQPPRFIDLTDFEKAIKNNMEDWLLIQYDRRSEVSEKKVDILRAKSVARLVLNNLKTMREFGVLMPSIVVRYYRALTIIDVIVLELDPEINFRIEFKNFSHQLRQKTHLESFSFSNRVAQILEFNSFLQSFPKRANELLEALKEEPFGIDLKFALMRNFGISLLITVRNISATLAVGFLAAWILVRYFDFKNFPQFVMQILDEGFLGIFGIIFIYLISSLAVRAFAKYQVKRLL